MLISFSSSLPLGLATVESALFYHHYYTLQSRIISGYEPNYHAGSSDCHGQQKLSKAIRLVSLIEKSDHLLLKKQNHLKHHPIKRNCILRKDLWQHHLSSSSTSITSITGTTMTYKVTINGVEIMIIATPKSLALYPKASHEWWQQKSCISYLKGL